MYYACGKANSSKVMIFCGESLRYVLLMKITVISVVQEHIAVSENLKRPKLTIIEFWSYIQTMQLLGMGFKTSVNRMRNCL